MLKFTACDAIRQFSSTGEAQLLRGITRGFERETLRVGDDGKLAMTPHPRALGSKLTHPWITTDYAEALLEFITPPSQSPDFPLQFLRDIHRFTVGQLGDEYLWAGSMPCMLALEDADIPIANYGRSNKARFKHVYREGLGLRYGRSMQTIAGVHYNWSLPEAFWTALRDCAGAQGTVQEFISERYFGLVRNFLRYGWLVPYLFGASPALCASFLHGQKSNLKELLPGTLYGPYATSLRMSDLGYQNRAQSNLHVSFNSLREYAQALDQAIRTPDPYYQQLGVRDGDHWKQLNANLLQIENEFYAAMRPKRVGRHGERPAKALQAYGVEYVEMRLFDLNPMFDVGIAPEQSVFADVLLLMCMFRDSPPISAREQAENDENKRRVVNQGRQPDLQLWVHNREQPFRALAHELFDEMAPFAEVLDNAYGGERYRSVMAQLRERITHPDTTPSAQVLEASREAGSYFRFAMNQSIKHKQALLNDPLDAQDAAKFVESATTSLAAQAELEASEQGSFEDYVASYYA